jgi:TetR/AcrR family transcriptional repressor of lmrAB and yxaGH operons
MTTDSKTLNSRDRLLRTGEDLFRRQGYSGTGLKEISAKAVAPWGSIYHFFPGGKEQLGVEVLAYAAELYRKGIEAAFVRYADPAAAVEAIFRGEIKILEGSQYAEGCPVAAVTLDVASTSEPLREACGQAFGRWLDAYASGFRAAGAPAADSRALAGFVLSALEGAILLSRAARSPAPLRQSAKFVREVVEQQAASWSAGGA